MLTALKFCQGAVAKKDFLPALTHFVIEDSRIRGFNGVLALSSPIPFDITCKPKASTLIKAIANCSDTVQLALTPAGRLSVKSAGFKAFVDCVDGETAHALPEGEFVELNGEALMKGLKAVAPFIGDDASRRWANGVLFSNKSLFATNNVMLVQYWVGAELPSVVNIPRDAVKEMLRIGEAPEAIQLAQNSITFHYSGERWLRTQLYDHTQWPNIEGLLNKPHGDLKAVPEMLAKGLEVIKPFVDKIGSVYLKQGKITTHEGEADGASYEIPELEVEDGLYNIEMLELLASTAKHIDWTAYPAPCAFTTDMLRGVLIGLKRK